MILFKSDWKKYPTASLHLETKNDSFIKYAKKLKIMGVKNYAFPLALINSLLRNIDPHSPNLTREEKAMIIEETKINPWYYFREISRIPAKAGVDSNPFLANRGNIALFWNFFNHVTTLLIQPRQTGKSVSTYTLHAGILNVWASNSTITLLTKDDTLRTEAVLAVKDIMSELPSYIQLRTKKDKNNSTEISIDLLGNKYKTAVGQASEKAALNVFRGTTTPVRHIDEFGYVKNIHITLSPYLAAGGAANEEAKANGNPYGTIFTTTPAYRNSKEGEFAYAKYSKGLRWSEFFYDLESEEALHKMVDNNSQSGIMIIEMNHRQLGKTDDWLRQRIKDAQSEGEDVEADYLNIWPLGSGASPIDKDLIETLNKSKRDPDYVQVSKNGYVINWYAPMEEVEGVFLNKPMIVAVDPSEAFGSDEIGFAIRDINTGATLGTGVFNETNTIEFSSFLADFLLKYRRSIMLIERKSSGMSMIDNIILLLLENNQDPFKRLFNWVVQEYDSNPNRFKEIEIDMKRRDGRVYTKYRDLFGYATSGTGKASREKIYGENIMSALKYTGSVAYDRTIIQQISDLKIKNGRLDHDSNKHDDLAISWLLGYWFLTNVKNSEFYGINPYNVLSNVTDNDPSIKKSLEEEAKLKEQQAMRNKIDEMLVELKETRDDVKSIFLINKIRQLDKRIDKNIIKSLNTESMIKAIQDMKLNKNKYNRSIGNIRVAA